ncbi:hypothetical protein DCAR_0518905 [Daucus carota subsp. sativus]|uniref:Uncharacterized protein n=1 Tax=Daucus carota subsp. sativus TaxID=79200 RepID=A0A164XKL6_DAUCS|nr:hypothetical protein DCAR_0518905 [Daucus carota subsp. sativus]
MVADILRPIQCLKREKEALLSEFQYVTSENNEIQMENSAMQDQIEKLQKELKENMSRVNLDLNIAPSEPGTPVYVIRVPLISQFISRLDSLKSERLGEFDDRISND